MPVASICGMDPYCVAGGFAGLLLGSIGTNGKPMPKKKKEKDFDVPMPVKLTYFKLFTPVALPSMFLFVKSGEPYEFQGVAMDES